MTFQLIDGQTNECSTEALPFISNPKQRARINNQRKKPSSVVSTPDSTVSIQSRNGRRTEVTIHRRVDQWFIGATLGKGGFSWVKKGLDIITGNAVALKFTTKANGEWTQPQIKQIENEINSLKIIDHKNVLKFIAYDLNAKYPQNDGTVIPTALLVLEYMPGGELFDILYYTSALNENLARTYFHQLIDGLEACHAANICHRDLKPQNLLLDSKFQLKIADFGLAKVFRSGDNPLMHTFYTGTRGYQAPEILQAQPYTMACDIFSCGVILFILLAGYPPFEAATSKCKWYRPLTTGGARAFWRQHRGCGITGTAKDLITRMLWYEWQKRIRLKNIKKHRKWYTSEKILSDEELYNELKKLHRLKEIKRKKDSKRKGEMKDSHVLRKAIHGDKIADIYDYDKKFSVLEPGISNMWSGNGIILQIHKFYEGDVIENVVDIVNAYVRSDRLDEEEDCTSTVIKYLWNSKQNNILCNQLLQKLKNSEMFLKNVAFSNICKEEDAYVRVIYSEINFDCEPPEWDESESLTMKDIYTTVKPRFVLTFIQDWVSRLNGKTVLKLREACMEVHLATHNFPAPVNIQIQIFQLRFQDSTTDVFLVKFGRLGGDSLHFSRVLNRLTVGCGAVLNGLPDQLFSFTEEEEIEADDKFDVLFCCDRPMNEDL